MSIVPLKRVTIIGLAREKGPVLQDLQRLGCIHLVPLRPPSELPENKVTERPEEALQALKYLRASGQRRHQVLEASDFDLQATVEQVLENRQRVRDATDRRDKLARRIQDREPWGDFEFPERDDLAGNRLWFYTLPLGRKGALESLALPWQIVHQDNLSAYVLVISPTEPPASLLPIARTHTGSESLRTLRRQLEETEIELDSLRAERDSQTRWIHLLEKNIARAEDAAALRYADELTLDADDVFAVQGWAPAARQDELQQYCLARRLGLTIEEPAAGDAPPTLLENPEGLAGGTDLVSFYQTPAYVGWDPSTVVLFSFALFFAMILGDAGYGLVLGGLLGVFWRRMGQAQLGRRMRIMGLLIVSLSVVYGIFAGSYFGVPPPADSLLAKVRFLKLDDFDMMMRISILIGAAHVALANVMRAANRSRWRERVEPLAWIAVIAGGTALWLFGTGSNATAAGQWAGYAMLAGGGLGILWFSGNRELKKPLDVVLRLLTGLLALTNVTKVFGDVLSYLRLFALGLASASLAITFNRIASDAAEGAPGAGLLLQLLILLLGHALNLTLAIVSGVVHGLRLNFIEFFNWGMDAEGQPFRPFKKREAEYE